MVPNYFTFYRKNFDSSSSFFWKFFWNFFWKFFLEIFWKFFWKLFLEIFWKFFENFFWKFFENFLKIFFGNFFGVFGNFFLEIFLEFFWKFFSFFKVDFGDCFVISYPYLFSFLLQVFEIFPILVHHGLMVKIRLITATVSSAAVNCVSPIVRRRRGVDLEGHLRNHGFAASQFDPEERLTVYEFLAEQQNDRRGDGRPPSYLETAVVSLESVLQQERVEADKQTTVGREAEVLAAEQPPTYCEVTGTSPVHAAFSSTESELQPPVYSSTEHLHRIEETILNANSLRLSCV